MHPGGPGGSESKLHAACLGGLLIVTTIVITVAISVGACTAFCNAVLVSGRKPNR